MGGTSLLGEMRAVTNREARRSGRAVAKVHHRLRHEALAPLGVCDREVFTRLGDGRLCARRRDCRKSVRALPADCQYAPRGLGLRHGSKTPSAGPGTAHGIGRSRLALLTFGQMHERRLALRLRPVERGLSLVRWPIGKEHPQQPNENPAAQSSATLGQRGHTKGWRRFSHQCQSLKPYNMQVTRSTTNRKKAGHAKRSQSSAHRKNQDEHNDSCDGERTLDVGLLCPKTV